MPQDSPAVRPSSRAMLLYRWWPTLAGQGGGVRAPAGLLGVTGELDPAADRKSTRLNSSHGYLPYAVFCLKKKKIRLGPTAARQFARPRALGFLPNSPCRVPTSPSLHFFIVAPSFSLAMSSPASLHPSIRS